jgi:apolipoprotein N-acyltransferase
LNKISHYFSTKEITRGLIIAVLGSAFIYLNHFNISYSLLNTILGILSLYLLLQSSRKVWFYSGFFVGLLWFWWIVLSFKHYGMLWAIPIGLLVIMLSYGVIFWLISKLSEKLTSMLPFNYPLLSLALKATSLLLLSYMHPFSFDWLKPELMFVESYIGTQKWQFALVLVAITLSLWKKQLMYLFLVVLAYQPTSQNTSTLAENIALISTQTSVQDKWDKSLHPVQFEVLLKTIDQAIDENKTLVILPESVFPIFLNRNKTLLDTLQKKSENISIVTGALSWDGKTPRNSTYIFNDGNITIANKVLLVPFGESNPLPEFLSNWVNKVFYDNAVDYKASSNVVDYTIGSITYRNAICFEATSEKLYEGKPKQMIVLSNNGWFTPSTEPTLQKLLLQYYSKKYGTTIYHSVNMSESYVIQNGISKKE